MTGIYVADSLQIHGASTVPGSFDVRLASGQWEIYELTGTTNGATFGPFSYSNGNYGPVTVDPNEIQVEASDGRSVAVHSSLDSATTETFSTGSRVYTGVASFQAPVGERFEITVADTSTAQVIVARPPFAGIVKQLGWIISAGAGGVLFFVALVLVIIALDQRRRPIVIGASPPGWRTDPSGRYQYRYWDGSTWTQYVSRGGKAGIDPL